METEKKEEKIQYLTIIPNNQFSFKFYINDLDEIHSKNLKEGEKFLLSFLKRKDKAYLNELLFSFLPFLIDTNKKEIIELQVDKEKELLIMRENSKIQKFFPFNEEKPVDFFSKKLYTNPVHEKIVKKLVKGWKL